jgi:hypothetical protein
MTMTLKILLAIVFLAVGFSIFWIAERQSKLEFSALQTCRERCAVEMKKGKLVPFSSTQITKRGDFTGPLKCECV